MTHQGHMMTHDYELVNTWSNMLQTADLKSSLEAKISNLSDQLREIKQYHNSFAPPGGHKSALDDVTNKKFETIQEIQNQQIQFQNYMMTQLRYVSRHVFRPPFWAILLNSF